jgi:hypothetical protein
MVIHWSTGSRQFVAYVGDLFVLIAFLFRCYGKKIGHYGKDFPHRGILRVDSAKGKSGYLDAGAAE